MDSQAPGEPVRSRTQAWQGSHRRRRRKPTSSCHLTPSNTTTTPAARLVAALTNSRYFKAKDKAPYINSQGYPSTSRLLMSRVGVRVYFLGRKFSVGSRSTQSRLCEGLTQPDRCGQRTGTAPSGHSSTSTSCRPLALMST